MNAPAIENTRELEPGYLKIILNIKLYLTSKFY